MADESSNSTMLITFSKFYNNVHVPAVVSLCSVGSVLNVANICVLTRPNMINSPTNIILIGLSFSQMLLLLNFMSFVVLTRLEQENCMIWVNTYPWVVYLFLNANMQVVSHTIALVHTTALGILRYLAIRFPSHSEWYSVRRAKIVSLLIFLLVPVACSSFYFNSRLKTEANFHRCPYNGTGNVVQDKSNNTVAKELFYTLSYSNNQKLLKFNMWLFSTVCKLLPCFVLTVVSILLLRQLDQVHKRHHMIHQRKPGQQNAAVDSKRSHLSTTGDQQQPALAKSSRDANHARVTKMLVIVVCLFVLVEAPQGLIYLLNGLGYKRTMIQDMHSELSDLFDLLTALYSSVNFLIYCCMSGEFRKTFKQLILKAGNAANDSEGTNAQRYQLVPMRS